MGSVGGNRSSAESVSYNNDYWSGSDGNQRSTTELVERYVNDSKWQDNMRKDLDLSDASNEQLYALRNIFQGMREHDTTYDSNRTPYDVSYFSVNMVGEKLSKEQEDSRRSLGLRNTGRPISVMITTVPKIDNTFIRIMDEKERSFLIGQRGGYFKYSTGKRVTKQTVKPFDAIYGKRTNSQ